MVEFTTNPRGWLARQKAAQARIAKKGSTEWDAIREARRAHRQETFSHEADAVEAASKKKKKKRKGKSASSTSSNQAATKKSSAKKRRKLSHASA